jgi:hypothetical protein
MTQAMFDDTYAGKVAVVLTKRGKGWVWQVPGSNGYVAGCGYVNCGYRPVPSAQRAINNARHDRRFSNVVEG